MGVSGKCLILMMILTIRARALQLDKIEKNPGLLPVKEGQALISEENWTVIKTLNLTNIQRDLDHNVDKYREFKAHISNTVKIGNAFEYNNIKMQTDNIMLITVEKFKQVVPVSRKKRGLINPLGSFIKAITGNLDNDDAERYDTMIKELKTNQDAIANKVTILSEMAGIIANNTNATRHNFAQINKELLIITRQINQSNVEKLENKIIQVFHLFIHNFQTIFIHLDDIETAIAFSRLKVLHQSIIDNKELLNVLKQIEITNKLVFPAKLANLVKIEQTIELKAYFKERQITFIMSIPLVTPDIYNYYRVIPLPILNKNNITTILAPKSPFILVQEAKTWSLPSPCQEIDENLHLCRNVDTTTQEQDLCTSSLMKSETNTSMCKPIAVEINNLYIRSFYENWWIVYSRNPVTLKETCKGEITRKQLRGTYLVGMDGVCDLQIQKVTLRRRHSGARGFKYHKTAKINLPEVAQGPVNADEVKPVNLDDINLDNLQLLAYALKSPEKQVLSDAVINIKSVSVGTVILYVIIVLVISIVIFYKIKKMYPNLCNRNPPIPIKQSDDFELKEGGVMSSNMPSRIIQVPK
ncbi:uncharacterized protein LOC135073933 [Ostrinia nubilalis]|uniref:uncharacterized protein LOC135073933 n=1 Tax=Ostrinia nubilalis TaxID=29057 RepID=UPI0030825CCB